MPHQLAVTVCARVAPGETDGLERQLRALAGTPGSPVFPFAQLAGVHFGRLLTLNDGAPTPRLLFMLDVDAPLGPRLDQLVDVAARELDGIFSHCEGYPDAASRNRDTRLAYIKAHLTDEAVFYVHAIGRSVEHVCRANQLRTSIEEFTDASRGAWRGRSAVEVRQAIRDFVQGTPSLAWAMAPPEKIDRSFRLRELVHMICVPLLLIVLLPLLLPATLIWIVWLRLHEQRDPPPQVELEAGRLRALRDMEDFGPQNQISTLAEIKPGAFWHLTAAVFLGIANYSARHLFTRGSLAGLRTVHFARFITLGQPRRVLFASYYDGSLESYMNDFIDKVAWVLNGVFGNEAGFPPTRWLFGAGARSESGFKAFLRGNQIPTQVWFSAYPHLTAANVDANSNLQAGLWGEMNETEAARWLQLL
jgi:hypothetical protein